MNSPDGKTGTATIGCYDGGAWTTLTVEAILEGGFRVKGKLLTPTGVEQIPIPKRSPDSKIATAWLAQYGSLNDTADHETIPGQGHKGDGLTTYEEYRGVIAGGNYKKLNPLKKELGLKATISDYKVFDFGIGLFSNASRIDTIKFIPEELPDDKQLNNNAGYANEHRQYALYLKIDVIREYDPEGNLRNVAGKAYGSPNIPELIEKIVIDTAQVGSGFREHQRNYRSVNATLPFSQDEYWGQVIAHELGHGVFIPHHGPSKPVPRNVEAVKNHTPPYIVRDENGQVVSLPWTIAGSVGKRGTQESGDLTCFMAYYPCFEWALHDHRNANEYFMVSTALTALGKRLCTSIAGTGMNTGGKYFGDADPGRGNCMAHIKMK